MNENKHWQVMVMRRRWYHALYYWLRRLRGRDFSKAKEYFVGFHMKITDDGIMDEPTCSHIVETFESTQGYTPAYETLSERNKDVKYE